MGLIVALVAVVAAAASIAALDTHSRGLEATVCAGVVIPTGAPAGSSIALVSSGESEVTELLASGNAGLVRAGVALRQALGQSDNARAVTSALTDAANECRILGLSTQPKP